MNMTRTILVTFAVLALASCKGVGFRDTDDARHHASAQIAREVLTQVSDALAQFHAANHRYPATTEVHLYDSIHAYFKEQIDPAQLYRNDGGKGFYIAIGSRSNRIVYRYPPTIGPLEYTLYWVGANSIDEEGEGDDLVAWDTTAAPGRVLRRRQIDLRGDHQSLEVGFIETGSNLYRDSVKLYISSGDSVLYSDRWPLSAYVIKRPELSDAERKRIVREELSRLMEQSSFVQTDSLLQQDWKTWADLKPKSAETQDIIKRNELMFNYYKGERGSLGIVWSPMRRSFVQVWKSA